MRGPYPGELRRWVIGFVEAGGSAVKRLNSSTSASVPRSGGCNAFARTALANRCRVAEALRHWRSTPNRSLRSTASDQTSHWMRSSWHCTSGEFLEAAARSPDFSLITASLLKKACAPQSESEPTWRGSADAGSASKGCLTPLALYLSMKLPSPPTWSVPTVGARAGNALLARFQWDIGKR